MKISKEEVLYIAKLAKLKFTDEEALELTTEFEGILKHFDSLKESDYELGDTSINEELVPTELREDKVEIFEENTKLFANAKDKERGYIKIPKVIE
ncbi:Asp-tRNA(Asn)/Glu-tRNA(Gln) amidotransferase subunit GatC [Serpentinicella alkaliphila]|uniref:Aspartyl/glutamyl-tRNA(Asn/Gln) amidotransferase subunit C n=1 Tax=Serpentinicella alkaliphila TaxID=1734049 RepID=A0A4R2TG29_9FIRM|nr:Asp-tRNA(Asn)/Glu-tRNA(Gln) amidotransferase subunit GatC [Serpentinicella alkaliphila]QUH25345.1 Asp-tRNA(Asn)/Glu-tRNA(Gln) amidotransferase subunit GatC [Serpentinicella alkaliphila]TCQ02368.1 aspartyl/glutamyl-tRNA(Asn/Gln) amidotransferase subunit C [Serpentinicella alkaliphila]